MDIKYDKIILKAYNNLAEEDTSSSWYATGHGGWSWDFGEKFPLCEKLMYRRCRRGGIKMIEVCLHCGNRAWNKYIEEQTIVCPICGSKWDFLKFPLFFITGASGVGKTTAAQILQRKTQNFIVLDADMFYNIMPHNTEEDALKQTEQIMYFSRNAMQCGKPLVWTKAGDIDILSIASGKSYFSEIACLALVCSDEQLQSRMRDGRGIKDAEWIHCSLDYNRYFLEHNKIGNTQYELLKVDDKTPEETATEIEHWLMRKMGLYLP